MSNHGQLEAPEVITALTVSHEDGDRSTLSRIFQELQWKICYSSSIAEARMRMDRGEFRVVICEAALPDGSWKILFRHSEKLAVPPSFIVSSRLADEHLWCEVLNVGGYDVLSTPFDRREVSHVVGCAWDSSRQRAAVVNRRNAQVEQRGRGLRPRVLPASGGSGSA